eukprot:scaffold2109_cov123-Isochrysis_galbana.AAC.19
MSFSDPLAATPDAEPAWHVVRSAPDACQLDARFRRRAVRRPRPRAMRAGDCALDTHRRLEHECARLLATQLARVGFAQANREAELRVHRLAQSPHLVERLPSRAIVGPQLAHVYVRSGPTAPIRVIRRAVHYVRVADRKLFFEQP